MCGIAFALIFYTWGPNRMEEIVKDPNEWVHAISVTLQDFEKRRSKERIGKAIRRNAQRRLGLLPSLPRSPAS